MELLPCQSSKYLVKEYFAGVSSYLATHQQVIEHRCERRQVQVGTEFAVALTVYQVYRYQH